MLSQTMDRESGAQSATKACYAHLDGEIPFVEVRQAVKGQLQELLGCESKVEFKYFDHEKKGIAHSVDDSDFCCRFCCSAIYPYSMRVKEIGTGQELFTVERAIGFPAACCKCFLYQNATISSGGNVIGRVVEQFYCCVPSFAVKDATGRQIYTIHPPTCCGGLVMNCCTENNNLCDRPFWIFDMNTKDTNGSDANHIGKIVKTPKSWAVEAFTDSDAFNVHFPPSTTTEEKATLIGATIFFNSLFFETSLLEVIPVAVECVKGLVRVF